MALACYRAELDLPSQSSVKTDRCFDASDSRDIRLWAGQAPGAMGTNTCTDIPFLRMYSPNGALPKSDLGIIVIPGGGYNELIDTDEQAPVAEYFANKLGITTFVLYYRLVQANGTYRYPVPMWDAQRAIRYVRANAGHYGIKSDHIGIFGFSARRSPSFHCGHPLRYIVRISGGR